MSGSEFWLLADRLTRAALPDRYLGNVGLDLVLAATAFTAVLVLSTRLLGLSGPLRRARRGMLASAYQMLLYRRSPRMILRGELGLIKHNLQYLLYLAPTIAIGGFLFAAVFDALDDRYGRRPLRVGEEAVLRGDGQEVKLDERDFAVEARVWVPKRNATWLRAKAHRAGLLPMRMAGRVAYVNVEMRDRPTDARNVAYPVQRWWGVRHGWVLGFLGICMGVMGLWPNDREQSSSASMASMPS